MALTHPWSEGGPFNWRGQRDEPVLVKYRYRDPGSIGENHKFPVEFLTIFGEPPYNRRMLDTEATGPDRAKAQVGYTTAWRDFIGTVGRQDFQPFAAEFTLRYDNALDTLADYMSTSHALVYHTWTGSRKKASVYKVAFPEAAIWNTVTWTPVPFHCSLAKLLGYEDDSEHRRNAALNVVSEYQQLLIKSGVYVENLVRQLATSHIAGINNRLGREQAARDAVEKEARKAAAGEATEITGKPKTLNELLGWVSS